MKTQEQIKQSVQAGFTLIELVMVIVILGILAAVAIPKFADLSGEASQAAVDGMAGGLASASATNYATSKAMPTSTTAWVVVDNCSDGGSLITGGLPTDYTITAGAVSPNATATCTVTVENGTNDKTATFTIHGT